VGDYPSNTSLPWWAWAIFIVFALFAAIGLITWAVENNDRRKRGQPTKRLGEFYDISPGTQSFLSGRNITSYTAKVHAVTPAGVRVRQARCCARGHQSPELAVAHANAIKARISRTGR
jgi:hypothetical protein